MHLPHKTILSLLPMYLILSLILNQCSTKQSQPSSIQIEKNKQQQYILQVQIGNKQYNLLVNANDQVEWIKGKQCVVCDEEVCQNGEQCGLGVNCKGKGYCKETQQSGKEDVMPNFGKQGKSVQLKIKIPAIGSSKLAYQTTMLTKMKSYRQQDGVFNLLSQTNSIFNDKILLIKNNDKDIKMYFYEEQKQSKPLYQAVDVVDKIPEQTKDNKQVGLSVSSKTISNIRFRQLFKNQQNNLKSQSGTVPQDPTQSILNISNISYKFDLQKKTLLLPPQIYKKLMSLLKQKYYKQCQIKLDTANDSSKSIVQCNNKNDLNLQKIDNITLSLCIQEKYVEIPMRALFQICRDGECDFTVGVSDIKKTIVIGDFILNLFAVQWQISKHAVTFYRINNQWSQNFVKDRKMSNHQVNFMWMFIVFIFKAIMWILKVIFYLAILALSLNCIYHWKQVLQWFVDILSKLTNKQLRNQLKQQNIKAFQSLSTKLKDKVNKKIANKTKNQKFHSVPQHSNAHLDQQVGLQQNSTKIMTLDELSDPSNNSQDQQQQQNVHEEASVGQKLRQKKQQLHNTFEEAKKMLVQKMQSKKQIPNILKSVPQQVSKVVSTNFQKFTDFSKQKFNDFSSQIMNKHSQQKVQQNKPMSLQMVQNQHEKQQQFYEFEGDGNQLSFADN